MPDFSETYASPGLRWGLLLEDHSRAEKSFALGKAATQNVPAEYGAESPVCVCTITFGSDRPDVVAYKKVSGKGDPDDWNLLCTKTLGRALKGAGYPDDMKDLKALVLWRQRNAEVAAVEGGHVLQAIEAPKPTDGDEDDLSRAAVDHGDEHEDAIIVGDDGDPPDDQILAEIRTLLSALPGDKQSEAQGWGRANCGRLLNPPTQAQAEAAVEMLEAMQDA